MRREPTFLTQATVGIISINLCSADQEISVFVYFVRFIHQLSRKFGSTVLPLSQGNTSGF